MSLKPEAVERVEGWRITPQELGPHPEGESCDEAPVCGHVYRLVTDRDSTPPRDPDRERPECAHVRADRDRLLKIATELHAANEAGEIGFWEARAYFIRDESIRDQLQAARDQIDGLLLRSHLAEEALKAHLVGRNPHSEVTAWKNHLKTLEDE